MDKWSMTHCTQGRMEDKIAASPTISIRPYPERIGYSDHQLFGSGRQVTTSTDEHGAIPQRPNLQGNLMDYSHLLPKSLRVGAQRYTFVPRDSAWYEAEECHGTCDFDNHEISIATEDRPLSEVFDTLLHEVLHVCWKEWYIAKRPREEPAVTALATGMAAVLSQNPEYLESISNIIKELRDGDDRSEYTVQEGNLG